MYSNKKCITEDLKSPSWLIDYYWWLAQYLYHYLILQYKNYAEFLEDHANQLPPSAAQLGLESKTIGWQFSRKGDAWNLCANQQTLDPLNPVGIKECDPSVSTVEKQVFMSMLGDPTPPPPPIAVAGFEVVADIVNIRLGPGTNYDTDGQLTKGAVGDVFATDGADVWYKIGANHWIASYVAGKRYSKLI